MRAAGELERRDTEGITGRYRARRCRINEPVTTSCRTTNAMIDDRRAERERAMSP